MTLLKKTLIIVALIALYLASTVPVGLFLYSLKSSNDIDIFRNGGWHSYMKCLKEEVEKIGNTPDTPDSGEVPAENQSGM